MIAPLAPLAARVGAAETAEAEPDVECLEHTECKADCNEFI